MSDERELLRGCGRCYINAEPADTCPTHGIGTPWRNSLRDRVDQATPRVPETPPLGSSIRLHADALILQSRRDLDEAKELVIEARNHAKLTQNMSLVRRMDKWLEKVGIL